jgi:sodium/potassium-transporting ATPase subunit alpha
MGISATDVAKDAADAILLTDDFCDIVVAIQESRRIYDNLKKSLAYVLSSQMGQMVPFAAFVVLQIPCMLTCALVLYLSLTNDLLPAIALANEQPEAGVITQRPRRQLSPAPLLANAFGCVGCI